MTWASFRDKPEDRPRCIGLMAKECVGSCFVWLDSGAIEKSLTKFFVILSMIFCIFLAFRYLLISSFRRKNI